MTFVIPGQPVPKGRPRFNAETGTAFTPRRTREYEKWVNTRLATDMMCIRPAHRYDPWPKDAPRYIVSLDFYSKNPLFADADNLAKCVIDGAIGVLWDDDRTVDFGHIRRHHDPVRPRCEMRVEVWG